VQRLARAGVDLFVCPDNTAHKALEVPGPDLALPGLHIAEVVATEAANDGRRHVVVCWDQVHDGRLYPRALGARGIAAKLPDADDRDIINRVIFAELVNGVFTVASRQEYVRIIKQLAERGCDAVALAYRDPLAGDTGGLAAAHAGLDSSAGAYCLRRRRRPRCYASLAWRPG
jgi:aspartate/glutamate racemase